MAEDLESVLALAFAPTPPAVRHVELQVFCVACGVQVSSLFPALGIPSEMKLLVVELVGKVCECGVTWSDPSALAVTIAPVDPSERGYAYCLVCRQIRSAADLTPWATGLRCRGCTALAEAVDEHEIAWKELWNVPVRDLHIRAADLLSGRDVVREVPAMSERRYKTACGDSRVILKTLADNSVDALCCDPPSGISFMGKEWDSDRGGRDEWVTWLRDIMKECLRVMKPGAHGFVWALPRTAHWTAMALEDAGFEVRDVICHAFGTGFPKSHNVAKAIDKAAGVEREVIAEGTPVKRMIPGADQNATGSWIKDNGRVFVPTMTAPATDEARRWDGWGTALKPAIENWILVRKPLERSTVAANVLTYGTGAINVKAGRVASGPDHATKCASVVGLGSNRNGNCYGEWTGERTDSFNPAGRWPANLVLSHSPDCRHLGTRKVKGCPAEVTQGGKDGGGFDVGSSDGTRRTIFQGYGDEDGFEEIDVYACPPWCAVRSLDDQAGSSKSRKGKPRKSQEAGEGWGMTATGAEYADSGGPSRFFFVAKPSKHEKSLGLEEGAANNHPTPKSVTLCRYLARLITPPGGTVLDCFAGSGSIGVAVLLEGFKFLGIEREEEYYATMRARLAHVVKEIEHEQE